MHLQRGRQFQLHHEWVDDFLNLIGTDVFGGKYFRVELQRKVLRGEPHILARLVLRSKKVTTIS